MQYAFTLIVPCYNESRNLDLLLKKINKLRQKVNFYLIIVNNGSVDETKLILKILKLKKKLKNSKVINIKKNIGFGNAIKKGIEKSKTSLICYTHADLQTDINDVYKAFKIIQNKKKILVKGLRTKRSLRENFFSNGMSYLNSIIFRVKITDIHGQPNFFDKKMISKFNYLPYDFSIDTYLILLAIHKKYKIIRFNVRFKKRKFGVGSNDQTINKLIYIFKSLWSSLKILICAKY